MQSKKLKISWILVIFKQINNFSTGNTIHTIKKIITTRYKFQNKFENSQFTSEFDIKNLTKNLDNSNKNYQFLFESH